MLSPKLKADIRQLWNRFWSGGIANPLTAIEQITYLVFLKRLEDLDNERVASGQGQSIYEPDGKQYRWSYLRLLPADDQVKGFRAAVDWLKEQDEEDTKDRMRDAVFVLSNPNLLRGAVEIIDGLFVSSRNADTLGDIYEMLLAEIAEAGKNGQFRTPRHIIRLMCDLVDPRPSERICDPACGTGGFLVNAYQHILKTYTHRASLEFESEGTPLQPYAGMLPTEVDERLRQEPFFYGYDFDRTMVRLGWMNLRLHGLEKPQVSSADTLGNRFNEQVTSGGLSYDVILANPPFTGNLDKTDVGQSLQSLGTNKTELLFLELILQLLPMGGRAAVIVPEGVLFGSTQAHKSLRRRLLLENQLNAVISLPGGVFQPYTNVKTSILVFNKGGKTEKVWFYEVQADGYKLNAKRNELPEINDLWDVTLKYRLRFAQDFRADPLGVFALEKIDPAIPAFLGNESATWQRWQTLSEEERTHHFVQPLLVTEEREVENGGAGNVPSSQPEKTLVRLLKSLETVKLLPDQRRDWIATLEELATNDYNLAAGRYKPSRLSQANFDPPSQLIAELQDIETQIQSGLNYLLKLVEGKDE